MRLEHTDWRSLYAVGGLLGAGLGALVAGDLLPTVPEWPRGWGLASSNYLVAWMLPIAGGALIGLLLVAGAHLGIRYQLRSARDRGQAERSHRRP